MNDPIKQSVSAALQELITRVPSEQGGPTAFNGLSFQVSYTFDLIIKAIETGNPFWIFLDYHDDMILILEDGSHFYQTKTKKGLKFKWVDLLEKSKSGKSIVSKMYMNLLKFEYAKESILISNQPFEIKMKMGAKKTLPELCESFSIGDLDIEIRKKFYEHVSEANQADISNAGYSLLVDSNLKFKTTDLTPETHEDTISGRLSRWLESKGYLSANDNRAFYKCLRDVLDSRYRIELNNGDSAESKLISSAEINTLIENLCKHSHSQIRSEAIEILKKEFSVNHYLCAKKWLNQYVVDCSDPNNTALGNLKKEIQSQIEKLNLSLCPDFLSMVDSIDRHIPSDIKNAINNNAQREVIIIYEVIHAYNSDELSQVS